MNFDTIVAQLRALYIEENPYRMWAWVLSFLLVMCFPRGTRRLAATGFFVVLGSMGIYFGMMSVYKQYLPDEPVPKALQQKR